MTFTKTLNRNIAKVLLICVCPFAVFAPVSQAAIIDTQQIITGTQAQSDRARLMDSLNRADLKDQMRSAGVNPDQLQGRIANLTDKEVEMLNAQLDKLPAGGSLIGYSVFIFLVLLMTDIMGYTDIFPFVKKTIN